MKKPSADTLPSVPIFITVAVSQLAKRSVTAPQKWLNVIIIRLTDGQIALNYLKPHVTKTAETIIERQRMAASTASRNAERKELSTQNASKHQQRSYACQLNNHLSLPLYKKAAIRIN